MNVLIRPAKSTDKAPLMSFIKDVWSGHDYIPEVWDRWLADRSGPMFVVEADGVPVGMNRVRFMEDGSAWFEGVRVHPNFRGRGLATSLGNNAMKVARERGSAPFRLTSGARNHQAHRQIARMGFFEVSRFSVYSPKEGVRLRTKGRVRVADLDDYQTVRGLINGSKEFAYGGGVMWDGFAATRLTDRVIRSLLRKGDVVVSGEAVAVVRQGSEGKEVWNQVCFAGGSPEGLSALVPYAFSRKVGDWDVVYAPQGAPLVGVLRRMGLSRSFSMILFERSANG